MRNTSSEKNRYIGVILLALFLCILGIRAETPYQFKTKYMTFSVNGKGYIESLKNKNGKEYILLNRMPALMNLSQGEDLISPVSAVYDDTRSEMTLLYINGSVVRIKIDQKDEYLRMEVLSVSPRNDVDNVVWGLYNTTISKTIGEIISVVRDDEFVIGILALDDNTTSGPPCDGDMYQGCYIIHSPDPKKYPILDGETIYVVERTGQGRFYFT